MALTNFARPTLKELRERVIAGFNAALPGTDARLRNSVLNVLAVVKADLANELYGYIDWLAAQIFPDTAEAENLDRCLAVVASWYDVAVTDIGFNANLVWIWAGAYAVDFLLGTGYALKYFSTVWLWSKFKRGASRVVPLTLMFIFGLTLAYILNATIGLGSSFMNFWLGYMVSIELLSILKNCDRLGWRLPYPLPEFTRWMHYKMHKELEDILKDKKDDDGSQ